MALRSAWKGVLRFSLVSVPVEAYTSAQPGEGEIHLNQLHATCHSRIRYKKTCPIHGEVPNDEIVMGYEYEKDKYVIFEPGELDKDRKQSDRSIAIDTFVPPDEIDPIYYDGRTYYLTPESAGAQNPYAVLCEAMTKMKRYAVAMLTLHGKEEVVLVRPMDGILAVTMLHYESQVRSPEVVRDDVPHVKSNAQELKLAQQLIESSTADDFDFSKYEDKHTHHMRELIEAKVAGKQIVAPPTEEEEVPVINLMDALKQSVEKTKHSSKAAQARKSLAAQLSQPGSRTRGIRQRRRKTS